VPWVRLHYFSCTPFGNSRLVGTEIAHAVPLTLVAGLGTSMGNLDLELLGQLLILEFILEVC
jgi:hypothetical protein